MRKGIMRDHLSSSVRYLCSLLLVSSALFSVGCGQRSITPPRSKVLEDAKSAGLNVPSVEEDRSRFFEWEARNKERLLELIEGRLDGGDVDPSYRIGAGDELEVRVFDVEEMNTALRVSQSGFIDLPLVSGVKAVGLTPGELEEELKIRLKKFVRDPQVSVFLTHFGSQEVAVIGAVDKPARYPLRKGSNSLLEVLTMAGGVTEKAGGVVNFIPVEYTGLSGMSSSEARARFALQASGALKTSGGVTSDNALEIALQDIYGTSGGIPLEIPVRGGDMVIVPEAGKVLVEGEVEVRGSFQLGGRSTLLGALAAAGGITYSAKIDEVELIRPLRTGDKLRLVIDLQDILNGTHSDVPVRDGDLIRVPSHGGRRLAQDTFNGIARIVNFGVGGNVQVAN